MTDETVPRRRQRGTGELTAGRRAARHLRELILGGDLPPGAQIRQEAVAHELGMSRIPVREALRELEVEGLIGLVAHGTARVLRLDRDEYQEIYKIREYLEPLAAGESARRITGEEVADLRALALAMNRAGDKPSAWLDLDRRFHLASYAAARMPRLLRTVESFWNSTQHYRRAFYATLTPEDWARNRATHDLIVDALERHDSLDAEELVRIHIRHTRVRLEQHPELFWEPPSAESHRRRTDAQAPHEP